MSVLFNPREKQLGRNSDGRSKPTDREVLPMSEFVSGGCTDAKIALVWIHSRQHKLAGICGDDTGWNKRDCRTF